MTTETRPAPLPVDHVPVEGLAHRRTRALMLAAHYGWIEEFAPIDAATVNPQDLTYSVRLVGGHHEVWHADEVLSVVYGLALAHGRPDLARHRDGLGGGK